jgi:anti-anti-sigma factor
MRRYGFADLNAPADANDHAAWGYSTAEERGEAVRAWLTRGLEAGYRALYVAEGDPGELFTEVEAIPGAREALLRGALVVMPTSVAYDLRAPINPAAQLAMYAAAVDQALADGYAGLRVAADITALVEDRSRLDSHLAWEQFADVYIAQNPLSPLCLYDTTRTGGVAAIACVHALQGPDDPALTVFAVEGRRVVRGEIDMCTGDVLANVLRAMPDNEVVLDLSAVEFIDARGAGALKNALTDLRASGRPMRVVGASPQLDMVWRLCGFDESLVLAS